MELTRREWLGCGAASAGFLLLPTGARASMQRGDVLATVVERVRAFAEADLASKGFPGMQIALAGPGETSATLAVGVSEFDGRSPARPDQFFQIGSISKSLAAMAAFVLAEQGKLDLQARVQDLLPEILMPPEPITVAQLLEHSSGLPNSLEESPEIAIPGRRLWTGFAPGSRFSYCNLGYALLGRIVARRSGMPFGEALQRLVLQPIGMAQARPTIRVADRARYAEGHVRFRDDMPWVPGARLTEARWLDLENAAGSVAATASDMIAYLRAIVALGSGSGGRLFSDAAARRFATATIDDDTPGRRYGNGLVHLRVEDRPMLRHTGGMPGFSSSFTADPAAKVGAYASVNVGGAGGYRPNEITEYAVALLRAVAEGRPLPGARSPTRAAPFRQPGMVAGRWVAAGGDAFEIGAQDGGLRILRDGVERPLYLQGDALVTDHPGLAPHYLTPLDGEPIVLRLGGRLYGRDKAPAAPPTSPRLAALAGFYFNPGGWVGRMSVFAAGDRLYQGTNQLREAPDGSWRYEDPALVSERLWFESVADGRPQVLNASGARHRRLAGS